MDPIEKELEMELMDEDERHMAHGDTCRVMRQEPHNWTSG